MDDAARARVRAGLRSWFRSPPRRHGEAIYTRHVSFLELFYDLVYVVVIGRAAHHLAAHLDWAGVRDFVIVFGLIWLAWFNGTFWHELHAREDGRSRLYIFGQMTLLALLGVFTGEATGDDGRAFAATYAVLFTLFTWQWYLVQRIDDLRYRPTTTRYLAGMVATVLAIAATTFTDERVRLAVWSLVVIGWTIGGILLTAADRTAGFGEGVTASLVERVGLFTIIVLGEVVVGVVVGLGDAEDRSVGTIATGMLGLTIGMGLWWNYFDLLGRRVPDRRGVRLALWLYVHLPLTMAIAGGGAAMVSVIEHAEDTRVPEPSAWLLSTSVAVVLASITLASQALPGDDLSARLVRNIAPTFGVAVVVVLALGAARPAPMLYVTALSLVLAAAWLRLFVVHLAAGGDFDVLGGGHPASVDASGSRPSKPSTGT